MTERYVNVVGSPKSGSMDCGVRGDTNPCRLPYQMPIPPTPRARRTFTTAPRFMIQDMSPTSCMETHTTNQINASSMAADAHAGRGRPSMPPMVVGNSTAMDASHVK